MPILLLLAALPAAALDYERDVMPIFAGKCYDCHSAEASKVKGGLRLDDPAHFRKRFSKGDVVVPGNWDSSYLFVVVTRSQDHKEAMPPKGKGEPLTPDEIMTVANWIHEGARVDGERGEKGSPDDKPADFIRFRDGQMVTEQFAADPASAPKESVPADWTNREGKTIRAAFLRTEGPNVILRLEDGREVSYPLDKLSDESRARAKEAP
jgi:cytochrome c5